MRKFKKMVLPALYLAAALSLTSCNKSKEVKEISEPAITYEVPEPTKEEKEIDEKEIDENEKKEEQFIEILQEVKDISIEENETLIYENDWRNLFKKLKDTVITYYYSWDDLIIETKGAKIIYNHFDELTISKDKKVKDEFSENFYNMINLIIKEFDTKEVWFSGWKNELDFSKLDLKNIETLEFCDFTGTFDSTKLNLENLDTLRLDSCNAKFNFKGINSKINQLEFYGTPLDIVKKVFSNCKFKNLYVGWHEGEKKPNKLKPLLEYFVKNNIKINTFDINESKAIGNEELNLMSKLNASSINIDAKWYKDIVNIDLILRDKINNIEFDIRKSDDENSEIGNINIRSNNKDLWLDFSHMNITENTHFSLPNSARVNFDHLDCNSINAFKDLKNVKILHFKESNGPGPEADHRGEIRYSKDPSDKYIDILTNKPVKYLHDYNEVLKKLSYYYKLVKVRDKLNVSEKEVQNYYYEKSIGDFVNLKSDDVTILKDGKETTSYFGTSIIRCISSIVMQKGDKVVVVDNMEDYENYKYKNYKVKGYNLVNEYSLNPDGTLTTEICVKGSDIKLVYTPFN